MKRIILIAVMLLITTITFAQVEFGIKGGLNLADITKAEGNSMKPSIYLGVLVDIRITSFLSIQPELIYSRQGTILKYEGVKEWARLNYLNLPVMFKFHIVSGLSFEVGPQFGYLLNSRSKLKGGGFNETGDIDGLKEFDVSIGLGLSYMITQHFDVSARYNIGLTKVESSDGAPKSKNGVIQIGVGYIF